eukprot:2548875-Rhodomonas_salina.1
MFFDGEICVSIGGRVGSVPAITERFALAHTRWRVDPAEGVLVNIVACGHNKGRFSLNRRVAFAQQSHGQPKIASTLLGSTTRASATRVLVFD